MISRNRCNIPVVADINADGSDEIAKYKPDFGTWTFDVNRNGLYDGLLLFKPGIEETGNKW